MTPPRLPRRLLAWLLPERVRAALLRDLDDEFVREVAPTRGRRAARRWYWRQALGSVVPALQLRGRPDDRSSRERVLVRWLADAPRDLRIGARRLRREPAFAIAAIVTLAIGIGATISIFVLTHAVLLHDLPFHEPDRLVSIDEVDTRRDASSGNLSYPDFLDYQTQATTFEAVEGFSGGSRTLVGAAGEIDRVQMTEVTPGFFAMLGVQPARGRAFTAADGLPGAPPVVMLTDGAWRRRFGGDPAVVGRPIELGSQRATVIGVLPAAFEGTPGGLAELWLPMQLTAAQRERRYMHWLRAIGRLRPGVELEAARADLDLIAARFASIDPAYHPAARVRLEPLHERVTGPMRATLIVLQAAAGFLLIVACANIASLLLARGLARLPELHVRAAIGAGRARLARQLFAESVALAVPGALAGLGLGVVGVRAFIAALPSEPRAALPFAGAIDLPPAVLLTTAGLGLLAAIGFGLAPAWQAGRSGLATLRVREAGGGRDLRLQSAFVAAQLALAVVLLAGAGLLGRSMLHLLQVSPGFDPARLLTLQVNGQEPAYATRDAARAMHAALLERIAALPAAAGAATISQLPLRGRGNTGTFAVQRAPGAPESSALIRTVSDGYFDVMGIPLLRGRIFSRADGPESPRVVLVNETLARTRFGGRAIGERIAFPFVAGRPWWEIVGVVGDEQFVSLDREMAPVVYFPFAQSVSNSFSVVLLTTTAPETLAAPVRDAVRQLDPRLPVYQIESMAQILSASDAVYRRRSALVLIAVFAIASVVLAAVGVYGLLAQAVAARTRELGIRIALGADRHQVLGAVLGRAVRLIAVGTALGLLIGVVSARALESLLFQVSALDGASLALAAAVAAAAALVGCLRPLRHALRIDPAAAIRGDV